MNIAVLGTGHVGGALGCRWAAVGHSVFFGARDPAGAEVRAVLARAGGGARAGSCREAIAACDTVLLAIPWDQTHAVLERAESLDGKLLIDCINPLTPDLQDLTLGYKTSAAEQIAAWFPTARVVKAFNTLSAATMENPRYGDLAAHVFICGDDPSAKETVHQLARELGFEPIECGPLRLARQLEPLAMLYVYLAVFQGWGGDCAFRMLKR
ncbi:MAG: NADPH-dependent F420 reductase [Pirellulaceae bacterium]|nr:NADPH-dependent F420 reductase [Pirellulaceae bacterium]